MYTICGPKADFMLIATSPAKLLICMQHEGKPLKGKNQLFSGFVSGKRCLVTGKYLFLNELLTLFWMHLHQVELGRN